MAGAAGFEPETSISETDVLPTKLHSNNAQPVLYLGWLVEFEST